jgi:citrate synthase
MYAAAGRDAKAMRNRAVTSIEIDGVIDIRDHRSKSSREVTVRQLKRERTPRGPDSEGPDYVLREEALALLGVKASTLYTYVSRGLIRSLAVEGSKTRIFSRQDLELLRGRSEAHAGVLARAQGSLRFGEPIINSQITEITADGPRYRGHSAIALAQAGCCFEAVSHLLWQGTLPDYETRWDYQPPRVSPNTLVGALKLPLPPTDVFKLFASVIVSLGSPDAGLTELDEGRTIPAAQQIIQTLAGCCGLLSRRGRFFNPNGKSVAGTIAQALRAQAPGAQALGAQALGAQARGTKDDELAEDAVNAALVLCADLELAPGTFAARIAASAGADIYNCVVAGMASNAGTLTSRGCEMAEELFLQGDRSFLQRKLNLIEKRGRRLYGFNHAIFPDGDPRVFTMLDIAKRVRPRSKQADDAFWLLDQAASQCKALPGVGIGLVVLAIALGLPRRSAAALWLIGRVAGQVAHVLEQRIQGFMIRPRARYLPGNVATVRPA